MSSTAVARSITVALATAFATACSGGSASTTTQEASPAPAATTASSGSQSEPSASPAPTEPSSAAPAEAEAIRPPASVAPPAAPTIALGADMTPAVGGFPAIAADGSTVAVADIANDGLRGAPNLTVRMFNAATGAARPAIAVMSVREGMIVEAGNTTAMATLRRTVEPRVTRAQAAVQGYRPLTAFAFDASSAAPSADATLTAHANGLDLTFNGADGALNVTDATTHAQRYHTVISRSRATGPRRRPECVENPALVRHAWLEPAAGILVIHVEYSGTDSCIAPDGSYRVVHLASASAAPAH